MRAHLSALLVAAAVATAACGGQSGADDDFARPDPPGMTEPAVPSDQPATAQVARAEHELAVSPAPGASPERTLAATTPFGSPRALLVLRDEGEWLEVAIPERPNGSTGWIRRDAVTLRSVDQAIDIDLAARTLTLWDAGVAVLSTPVAIGAPDAPTPAGEFSVVDKLASPDPTGSYGPFALGLSAFSSVFTEFAGGDGQIGIHGTNDPASIGQAVSHGCIRVPNDVIETLNQVIELGTPVTIR